MRILVCSKRDLTSVVILNDLLARLAALPGCELGLWFAERTRSVETTEPELVRMKFLERDLPFGVVFPLVDREGPRGQGASVQSISRTGDPHAARLLTADRLIAAHGLTARVVTSLRAPETLAALDAFKPDLIISVRFSFVFGPALIARPRHGIINVHPGALPRYAGLYPHFHSMLAGEAALGCTVHRVDQGIDSGPVLASGTVSIDPARSAFAHNLDSHLLGNRLVAEIAGRLVDGRIPPALSQDRAALRYRTYPTRAEFERFHEKGFVLVDEMEYLELLKRFMDSAVQSQSVDAAVPFHGHRLRGIG